MQYEKTIWVNGQPPAINATNLNKIEDGIEAAIALSQGILVPSATGEDWRYDWDTDGNLEYAGYNSTHDASEDSTDWVITKFSYDSDDQLERQEVLVGAWSGRIALGWGV